MNILKIKQQIGLLVWVLGVLELVLIVAYFALANPESTGGENGGPRAFCRVGMWTVGLVLGLSIFGYLFLYRFLGISRESWINNRAIAMPDEKYGPSQQAASAPSSTGGMIPLFGLMLLVIGLAAMVGTHHVRHPSLFSVVEKGSVGDLKRQLTMDVSEIDSKDEHGNSLLMVAAEQGRAGMVDCLLSIGASVGATDRLGRTALFHALGHPDLLEKLLLSGADPNVTDRNNTSALHAAVSRANREDIRLLLQYGAHVNQRNRYSDTPLLMALKSYPDAVSVLLMYGADPDMADQIGDSPLHVAAASGDSNAARALVDAGAKPTPVSMQNWMPLHVASMNGSLAVIEVLLQAGVDIDLVNKRLQTPLTCAIQKNRIKTVEYLLEHGADIALLDRHGNSYLHLALMDRHYEIATMLVHAGADLDVANDAGITPRKMLKSSGHDELLEESHMVSRVP